MSTAEMRELFIDELEEVHGGGPVEDAIATLKDPGNSTMACCEEGDCCD